MNVLLFLVLQPGEPGRQPLDRRLEVRVEVDEVPQPLGQPLETDLLLAPTLGELFDAPVGEVHVLTSRRDRAPDMTRARWLTHRALAEPGSTASAATLPSAPAAPSRASWPSPPQGRPRPGGRCAAAGRPRDAPAG